MEDGRLKPPQLRTFRTPEETLAFNQQLWHNPAFRKAHINQVRMHNATVAAIFQAAQTNEIDESVAVEIAMIALAEESDTFREIAVEAIGRAMPRASFI